MTNKLLTALTVLAITASLEACRGRPKPYSRTIENITKQECFHTPGSIDWRAYSGQDKIPPRLRLGTCYVED
jgi:hypothetical protein